MSAGYGGTEGLPLTWRMRVALWLTRGARDRAFAVARHTAEENARLLAEIDRQREYIDWLRASLALPTNAPADPDIAERDS